MLGRGFGGSDRNGSPGGAGRGSGLGGGLGGSLNALLNRGGSSQQNEQSSGGFGRGREAGGGGGLGGALGSLGGRGGGSGGGLGGGRGGGGGLGGGMSSIAGGPQKLVGTAVQGVASGIGLVSERAKGRKDSKGSERNPPSGVDDHPEVRDGEALEMEWALDDAQDSIVRAGPSQKTEQRQNSDQVADAFLAKNMTLPEPVRGAALGSLPYPVLLPQRRPKDRTRGFIRAYAPDLMHCGIDEKQWLAFLDAFEKSSQSSPWIQALNLASFATMVLPSVTAFAVSAAVQVATMVAAEGQTRYKTNTFLERINRNYFQPRGLFCLVLTWNPDSEEPTQSFDMAENIVKTQDSRNKFKGSNGKSFGESMFAEVAPLVFPHLDHLQDQNEPQAAGMKKKLKSEKAFLEDYWDRRATAKYAMENPDSVLANSAPPPKFTSRYSDPTHKASSGDLISLITGGHLSAGGGLQGIVGKVSGQFGGQNGAQGAPATQSQTNTQPARGLNIKKFLGKNVLYLLVVNMPSEQDMAEARANLAEGRGR